MSISKDCARVGQFFFFCSFEEEISLLEATICVSGKSNILICSREPNLLPTQWLGSATEREDLFDALHWELFKPLSN